MWAIEDAQRWIRETGCGHMVASIGRVFLEPSRVGTKRIWTEVNGFDKVLASMQSVRTETSCYRLLFLLRTAETENYNTWYQD